MSGFVRLLCMHRLVLLTLALSCALALPASAQESGAELAAEVGIDNWVEGNAPMTVHATVTAQILVTGTLEIIYGGATTHVPVDVPSGGAKTYDIPMRSAFGTGSIRVNLLDDDGERIASQTVRPDVADDEVLVAVVADTAVFDTIGAMQSGIDGIPIEPVLTDGSIPSAEAGAFAYLVDTDPVADTWTYVADGGRLVTSSSALATAPIDVEPLGAFPGTSVEWYRASGSGEIFVLETIASADDWRAVLRPAPLELIPSGQWGTPESSLLQSASSGGDGGLASIPWLPFGMIAYLVVIGPANLFVLRRIGRRELAWVTIPALALTAVGVFWIAGRQRLEGFSTRHATIVVSDDHPYRRSLTLLAAGKEGDYSISITGSSAYAISDTSSAWNGNLAPSSAGFVDAAGVVWDLPQLGVGAVETWGSPEGSLDATFEAADREVRVTNNTGATIDHWGAVVSGQTFVSQQTLAAGQTATLELDNQFAGWQGSSMGDAVVEMKQLWNETGWEVIAPLGYAASGEAGSTSYAFGISERSTMTAQINGASAAIDGPTAWVTPFSAERGANLASATIVGVGDFLSIDVGQGNSWIDTNHLLVSFDLPEPASEVWVQMPQNAWAPAGPLEAWNWQSGEFESITENERLDASEYLSPIGELLVRSGRNEQVGEVPQGQWLQAGWSDAS